MRVEKFGDMAVHPHGEYRPLAFMCLGTPVEDDDDAVVAIVINTPPKDDDAYPELGSIQLIGRDGWEEIIEVPTSAR